MGFQAIVEENGVKTIHDNMYFFEKFTLVQQSQNNYALLTLNIKNFRYYNTYLSTQQGDEILDLFFNRLLMLLEEEEYIAHLYADNFGMLLKYDDLDELIYERIMNLIDKIYRIEDPRIYRNIFITVGVCALEEKTLDYKEAINRAHLSRKSNKNIETRISSIEIYEEDIKQAYLSRTKLEEKTADAYKNYEFVTFLQPKIDLKTNQICGAEALLRWFDEAGNMIPLDSFLPILNKNSYIILVDLDIFEQMCQFLDRRIKAQLPVVPISFNISKAYFYDPNLVKDYISVFEQYDLPKNLIEIELLESISLNDTNHMKKIIHEFHEYGFTVALDDFGSGFSSFAVLLNAALDVVKMDRQFFVDNLNGDAQLIIKTVVDLLHSLNLKVVAEGVERQEHVDYLKALGCDAVQGYYYYKPMSVNDFEDLLEEQN